MRVEELEKPLNWKLSKAPVGQLPRLPGLWLVALSLLYFVTTFLSAAHERLWYDEILTLHAASLLPSLTSLWSFLKRGLELNPPLSFILAAGSERIFGHSEFALRFPAAVEFWVASACLYVFLRRRVEWPYAMAGMLLPTLTAAGRYSYEARPYALVLAMGAAALVAWQSAAEGRGRPWSLIALGGALAAALCAQPFAVTLALPFAAGEAWRTVKRKRVDWPVWVAFAASTPPLWLLWKLKGAAHTIAAGQSATEPWRMVGLTYFLILMPAILPVAAALFLAAMSRQKSEVGAKEGPLSGYEWAALAGFALIPLAAVPIARMGGLYWPRYSLNMTLGLGAALAVLLSRMAGGRRAAGMAIAALFTLFYAGQQLLPPNKRLNGGMEGTETVELQRTLEDGLGGEGPVAVGRSLTFVQLEHYASAGLAARLYYLTDPRAAARWTAQAAFDINGPVLQQMFPFRAHFEEYGKFVAEHRRFTVVEGGWIVDQLRADGAGLTPAKTIGATRCYAVTLR